MKKFLYILFGLPIYLWACTPKSSENTQLSIDEKLICSKFQIDSTIIKDIREHNSSTIEPFHYSLSKTLVNGEWIESDPINLNGIVFQEQNPKSENLILKLKDGFKKKGYGIFLVENNFNIDNKPDYIAVLKTTDKYEILKQVQTDGINYDITNDSLLTIIKQFDLKYPLDLIGASGDWCSFIILREPPSWLEFANEVYKVCPDVVDQGTGTVEELASEMKRTKRLYFWWD